MATERGSIYHGALSADIEERQRLQDEAVIAALARRIGTLLPRDRDIQVSLCGDPRVLGIQLEQLAAAEAAAYAHAGYGSRAERVAHFEDIFRGYADDQHGPPRHILITERGQRGSTGPQVLVWGDYFEVDDLVKLDPVVAEAIGQWRLRNATLRPGQFVGSKFVTDPTQRKLAVGLRGLAGLALAASLEGLAAVDQAGIMMAARTQHASQRLIRGVLPRLVPGIEIILDRAIDGEGAGGAQAWMAAYVPPPHTDERQSRVVPCKGC